MQSNTTPVITEAYEFPKGKAVMVGWTWHMPGSPVSHGPFKTRALAQADIAKQLIQQAAAREAAIIADMRETVGELGQHFDALGRALRGEG